MNMYKIQKSVKHVGIALIEAQCQTEMSETFRGEVFTLFQIAPHCQFSLLPIKSCARLCMCCICEFGVITKHIARCGYHDFILFALSSVHKFLVCFPKWTILQLQFVNFYLTTNHYHHICGAYMNNDLLSKDLPFGFCCLTLHRKD